ncbi:hypothetical protein [Streptomyces telluris]|uniref:Uncharacterized protein n=1 Tax=Streptomyces telluris TaxID=2720021 RepID=A0A9X2LQB2_9ACTN|nr:hypothetical protein [Streptomyces telluris]MCQ8773660.1 hypothetical protein [Streptomyces telluris]NJP80857.1 hypothetical protein [Streptomyces telluris]
MATAFGAGTAAWLAATRGRGEATAAAALVLLGAVVLTLRLGTLPQVREAAPADVAHAVMTQSVLVGLLVTALTATAARGLTTTRQHTTDGD